MKERNPHKRGQSCLVVQTLPLLVCSAVPVEGGGALDIHRAADPAVLGTDPGHTCSHGTKDTPPA